MFRWMWMACLLPVFLSIFLSTLDYHLVCLIISGSNCVLASLCSNLLTDYIYIQLGIQIPDIPPQPISDQDVIFSYLTNANRTPRLIIGGQVVTNLFQPNKKSIFIIHGSQGSSSDTWIKEMSHNIFDVEDCQIVWVDWEKFSKLSHTEAAMYSREVGRVVGSFIINHNIPPASIHFISHSMGGHISGFAGKLVFSNTGNKIGRISAMDLGGNQFINKGENDRLAKNDAVMVDHVHTDGGAYGYDRPDFKVDLFANGGVKFQPGCPIYVGLPATLTEAIKEILTCSHFRSIAYYIESIKSRRFIATKCSSYQYYLFGLCSSNEKIVFGYHMPLNAEGKYYFNTNAFSPFARGLLEIENKQ